MKTHFNTVVSTINLPEIVEQIVLCNNETGVSKTFWPGSVINPDHYKELPREWYTTEHAGIDYDAIKEGSIVSVIGYDNTEIIGRYKVKDDSNIEVFYHDNYRCTMHIKKSDIKSITVFEG